MDKPASDEVPEGQFMSVKFHIIPPHAITTYILLKETFGMEMTQTVEKEIDQYDWMLVSYGEDHFENKKKQCREEGERKGFVKGEAEKSESITVNMLTSNYPPEEISKLTKLDLARIHQLAKFNNLEKP